MNKKEDKKELLKPSKYVLVLLLLSLAVLGNLVLMLNRNEVYTKRDKALLFADSSLSAKLQVEKYLNNSEISLNTCKTNNDELNITIENLNNEIKKKLSIIDKMTADYNSFASIKEQLRDAHKLNEDCEKQVNHVLKESGEMESKIASLNKILTDAKKDNEELKNKLKKNKNLKIYAIRILNYKVNKGKQKPEIRAKKINKLSVSFILGENGIAESGKKTVYLVIYDFNKNILGKKTEKFIDNASHSELAYSSSKAIDYNNEEQKITIDYDTEASLLKGEYYLDIFIDGNFSGKHEFELK